MDSWGWSSGCSGSLSLICSRSRLFGDFWQGGKLDESRNSVSIAGGGSSRHSGGGDGCGSSGSEKSPKDSSIFGSSGASCSGSDSGSATTVGDSGAGEGGDGGGVDSSRDSSSFFSGEESGDPGEQRSMVRDLSSVSLELATMPLSLLLLPQSRLRGLRAGGDLLSMARGEATGDGMVITGGGATGAGRVQDARAKAGGSDRIRFGFGSSLMGVMDVALVATDADRTSLGTGADC